MLEKIMNSLLIGFAVAAIPGAVFIETIRRTLTKNVISGILLVLGEFFGHVLLFLILFFGVSHFFTNELVSKFLYLAGFLLMLLLGLQAFKNPNQTHQEKSLTLEGSSFLVGFGLSITDPYIIGLWVTLSGAYLSHFSKLYATFHIILISLGFLLFFIPLIYITYFIGKKIPDVYLLWLSRIGGVVLIGTAIMFFWKLILLF